MNKNRKFEELTDDQKMIFLHNKLECIFYDIEFQLNKGNKTVIDWILNSKLNFAFKLEIGALKIGGGIKNVKNMW